MKNFSRIILITIFLLGINFAYASQEDVVTLDSPGFRQLSVPKTNPEIYARINQDGDIISDEDYYEESDYFKPEEDISRNKTEQKFQNFVDKVIINNKLNDFTNNYIK